MILETLFFISVMKHFLSSLALLVKHNKKIKTTELFPSSICKIQWFFCLRENLILKKMPLIENNKVVVLAKWEWANVLYMYVYISCTLYIMNMPVSCWAKYTQNYLWNSATIWEEERKINRIKDCKYKFKLAIY